MEETIVHNRNEKPNSYEFGRAGNRWKIYFDSAEDLKQKILELRKNGFDIEVEI
jgi:hypothetical protein